MKSFIESELFAVLLAVEVLAALDVVAWASSEF